MYREAECERFAERYPVGTKGRLRLPSGENIETRISSPASMVNLVPAIECEGVRDYSPLSHFTPIQAVASK